MSWIAFYNKEGIGDVLLLTRGPIADHLVESQVEEGITFIKDETSQEIQSINIFDAQARLNVTGNGQVTLSKEQVDKINDLIAPYHDIKVQVDGQEKFVVGHVIECEKMADSDHLSITKIQVSQDQTLQIVCGARNMKKGLYVIVALAGAVMPSGSIIWDGQLRGVPSYGMVCSTRELNLTHIEDYPGIWELSSNFEVGTPLSQVVASYQK